VCLSRPFHDATGRFATSLDPLRPSDIRVDGLDFQPVLQATPTLYDITAKGFNRATVHIA
jgi:hypothetical protein